MTYDDAFYAAVEQDVWDALGVCCGGYSSDVDDDLIKVVKVLVDPGHTWVTNLAKLVGISPTHAELIQYILCSADWCEYGTSPRGCWLNHGIDKPRLLAAIDKWYTKQWAEQP